jgi:copper chaperone
MKTLNFKTNMKCGGCVATVTPFLNNVEGVDKWNVDTTAPDKILTVSGENVDAEKVKDAVTKAGFQIMPIK